MTMKKIVLSALAATMVTSVALAGTITADNGGKISEELLSFQNVNVTNAPNGAEYVPTGIPATSLKNPIFKFTFANMKDFSADNNVSVYEFVDGNETNCSTGNTRRVAGDPQISGTNSNIISFNAISSDIYAYNGRSYLILEDADDNITVTAPGGECTTTDAPSVKGQVAEGSTADATLAAELYSGDSQGLNDSAGPVTLYTISKEWSATVKTQLNAQIDAAASFFSFITGTQPSTTSDLFTVTVTRDTMITDGQFTPTTMPWVTLSDQNLTANDYANQANTATQGTTATSAFNDFNVTANIDENLIAPGTSLDANITYEVDGASKINKTMFETALDMSDGTNEFNLITSTSGNAGKWTVYGYQAQIPKVTYETAGNTIDTKLAFTNRSGLTTSVFFSIYAEDGSSCEVEDTAALSPNTTKEYAFSTDVLAQCPAGYPTTGSFSVEISIPTTPDSVYGFASFKNKTLGRFKDLPIYNTSKMAY